MTARFYQRALARPAVSRGSGFRRDSKRDSSVRGAAPGTRDARAILWAMSVRLRACVAGVVAVAASIAGCSSLGYYTQAARGQLQLLANREPIEDVIAQPGTSESLKKTLQLVLQIRDYASAQLALPDNGSYRSYVDIERPYVVWNLFAAPEFSIEPKRWCFPFVGCLSYKGYFDEAKARAAGSKLEGDGYDVFVGGIAAYSTLGHFDDPFLSSMLRLDEAVTAGIVFHELAHQRIYVRNDTELNEAFASLVEDEGVRRWLGEHRGPEALAAWTVRRERERAFAAIVGDTRTRLGALYASSLPEEEMRTRKAAELDALRARYAELKAAWGGYAGYDPWFDAGINNARIASVATYQRLVPALRVMLADAGDDLPRFYAGVEALGELSAGERDSRLAALLARASP
jgi:predicted aminopeptidase